MNYRDRSYVYPKSVGGYGKETLDNPHLIPCVYEQTTSYTHGNSQDGVSGTSTVFLMPNAYLESVDYRLDGHVMRINPYSDSQFFRVISSTVYRDTLLSNQIKYLECSLEPIEVDEAVIS